MNNLSNAVTFENSIAINAIFKSLVKEMQAVMKYCEDESSFLVSFHKLFGFNHYLGEADIRDISYSSSQEYKSRL